MDSKCVVIFRHLPMCHATQCMHLPILLSEGPIYITTSFTLAYDQATGKKFGKQDTEMDFIKSDI